MSINVYQIAAINGKMFFDDGSDFQRDGGAYSSEYAQQPDNINGQLARYTSMYGVWIDVAIDRPITSPVAGSYSQDNGYNQSPGPTAGIPWRPNGGYFLRTVGFTDNSVPPQSGGVREGYVGSFQGGHEALDYVFDPNVLSVDYEPLYGHGIGYSWPIQLGSLNLPDSGTKVQWRDGGNTTSDGSLTCSNSSSVYSRSQYMPPSYFNIWCANNPTGASSLSSGNVKFFFENRPSLQTSGFASQGSNNRIDGGSTSAGSAVIGNPSRVGPYTTDPLRGGNPSTPLNNPSEYFQVSGVRKLNSRGLTMHLAKVFDNGFEAYPYKWEEDGQTLQPILPVNVQTEYLWARGQDFAITQTQVVSNVLTVTCNNTLSPGNEIIMNGLGNSSFLNGLVFTVVTASSTQFTASFIRPNFGPTSELQGVASFNPDIRIRANATFTINDEYYGMVMDTKCTIWSNKTSMLPMLFFDLSDTWTASVAPRIAGVAVTGVNQGNITSVSVTSNIATVVVNNNYQVGQKVFIQSLVGATFLNNQTLTVLTATPLQFTAAFTNANYGPTADTGTAGGYKLYFLSEDGILAIYDFTQFNGAISLVGFNAPTPAQTFEKYAALKTSADGTKLYALYGTMASDPRLTTVTGAVAPRVGFVSFTIATNTWQSLGAASFSPNQARINGRSLHEAIVLRDGRLALACEKISYTNPNVRNAFWSNGQGYSTSGNTASITNSALTSNVATFQAVNNFIVGQEVELFGLTNGGFTSFNLFTVVVASATGSQFTANITNADIPAAAEGSAGAQPVPNNIAWQVMVWDPAGPTWNTSIIDATEPSAASPRTSGTITNVNVTSQVLTITCKNSFSAGQVVRFTEDFSNATWLNGQTVTIATASSTQFTVNNFPYANYNNVDGTAHAKQGLQYGSNFGHTGNNNTVDYWFYMPNPSLHDVGINTLLVQGSWTTSQLYALDITPPTSGVSNSNLTNIPPVAMFAYKNGGQYQGFDPYVPAGSPGMNPALDAVTIIHSRDYATNADRTCFFPNALTQFFAAFDVPMYVAPPSHNFKSTMAPVTSVQITGNVLTVQAVNNFVAGQSISFSAMQTATFLNGTGLNTYPENITVTVLAAGLSGTQFSANFQHANYGPTAETTAFASQYLQRIQNNTFATGALQQFDKDKWCVADLGTNSISGGGNTCRWTYPVQFVDNYVSFVRIPGNNGYYPFPTPGNALIGICSQTIGFLPTYYKYSGNGNGVNTPASITNVTVASNVLTIAATNTLNPGDRVTFSSVVTATFLNGVTVTVLTATGANFTAAFNYPNYPSAADTGNAQVLWLMADNWGDAYTNPFTIPGGSFSSPIPLPYGLKVAFGPAGGDTFTSTAVDNQPACSEFFTFNVAWGNTKFARKARFAWAMFAGQTFLQTDSRTVAQENALSLNFIDTDQCAVTFTAPTNVVGGGSATLGPGASGGQFGWTTQVTWPKFNGSNNAFDATPLVMDMTCGGFDPATLLNKPVTAITDNSHFTTFNPTGSGTVGTPYTWVQNGVTYNCSSSGDQFNNPSYYAFAGNPQIFWKSNAGNTGALQIDLGSAQTVRGYSFRLFWDTGQTLQGAPTNWTLQGSNTGLSGPWTTVDTQTGFSAFARGIGFNVGSPGSFQYYQLNITTTSGAGAPAIAMLQLFSAVKAASINFTDLTFMSFGNQAGGSLPADAGFQLAFANNMSRGYKFEVSINNGGSYSPITPLWRSHMGWAYSFPRQTAITNLRITCQQGWNYSTNPFSSGGLSNPLTAAFGPIYLFDYGTQVQIDAARLGLVTAPTGTPAAGSFDTSGGINQCLGIAGDAMSIALDGGSPSAFSPSYPAGIGGQSFPTFQTNQYYEVLSFWDMNSVPPAAAITSGIQAYKVHPFFGFLLFQGAGSSGSTSSQTGTNLKLTYHWGRRV